MHNLHCRKKKKTLSCKELMSVIYYSFLMESSNLGLHIIVVGRMEHCMEFRKDGYIVHYHMLTCCREGPHPHVFQAYDIFSISIFSIHGGTRNFLVILRNIFFLYTELDQGIITHLLLFAFMELFTSIEVKSNLQHRQPSFSYPCVNLSASD